MTQGDIRGIPELQHRIKRDKAQLEYLRAKATSVPALGTKEKVKSSVVNQSMRYVDAAVDLEEDIKINEARLKELKREAREWISSLPDLTVKRLLRIRFLKCYTIERTAELMGYSDRQVYRIIEEAIAELPEEVE